MEVPIEAARAKSEHYRVDSTRLLTPNLSASSDSNQQNAKFTDIKKHSESSGIYSVVAESPRLQITGVDRWTQGTLPRLLTFLNQLVNCRLAYRYAAKVRPRISQDLQSTIDVGTPHLESLANTYHKKVKHRLSYQKGRSLRLVYAS